MLTTSSLAVTQSPSDADPPTADAACRGCITTSQTGTDMQKVLDALGLNAVRVNGVLRRLHQDGLMDFRNGLLIISSVSRFAHVAAFDDQHLQRRLMAAA